MIVKPRQQVNEGRFTGAGFSNESDFLTRPGMKGDVFKYPRILAVREINMIEFDVSLQSRICLVISFLNIFPFFDKHRVYAGIRNRTG